MTANQAEQRFIDQKMLEDFLRSWPIEKLHAMSLRQYNHTLDKETFCQCVETKTRPLGSIKGNNSSKFGIFRQRNKESRPKNTVSNNEYTWETKFTDPKLDEKAVFSKVIAEIQLIANLAMAGNFQAIESSPIYSLFRWKIAYLYSQNRLIPIFAKNKLTAISIQQGMVTNRRTTYLEMQEYLMSKKPFDMTVVEYMRKLFTELDGIKRGAAAMPYKKRGRRGTMSKKGGGQLRSGSAGYTATLFHDDIQQALYDQLCATCDQVSMETDWADIIVELPEKVVIYEVKTARYAADCMLEGIGQAMGYAFRAGMHYGKPVELVIAGPNKQSEEEIQIMEFIHSMIKLPISYHKIAYGPNDV